MPRCWIDTAEKCLWMQNSGTSQAHNLNNVCSECMLMSKPENMRQNSHSAARESSQFVRPNCNSSSEFQNSEIQNSVILLQSDHLQRDNGKIELELSCKVTNGSPEGQHRHPTMAEACLWVEPAPEERNRLENSTGIHLRCLFIDVESHFPWTLSDENDQR